MLERGKGVFVYDTSGKSYIEGMAGLWCTALGYGNEGWRLRARPSRMVMPANALLAHLFPRSGTSRSHAANSHRAGRRMSQL
jgi:4-aminobutyrate aminotransferase-like enzyme